MHARLTDHAGTSTFATLEACQAGIASNSRVLAALRTPLAARLTPKPKPRNFAVTAKPTVPRKIGNLVSACAARQQACDLLASKTVVCAALI